MGVIQAGEMDLSVHACEEEQVIHVSRTRNASDTAQTTYEKSLGSLTDSDERELCRRKGSLLVIGKVSERARLAGRKVKTATACGGVETLFSNLQKMSLSNSFANKHVTRNRIERR